MNSQKERLSRLTQYWKNLTLDGSDLLLLGDANLCAKIWEEDSYRHKVLAQQVQDFLMESSCYQIINKDTRIGSGVDREVCSAIPYHCYTYVPEKIAETKVVCVGSSDHMGFIVKKLSKIPASRPQTLTLINAGGGAIIIRHRRIAISPYRNIE